MTLTQEQLCDILDVCNRSDGDFSDGESDAVTAARADLAAMRTPITAENLTAAGWFPSWELEESSLYLHDAISSLVEVEIDNGVVIVNVNDATMDDPRRLPNVTNMYALGQLVELLGGAK